MVTIDDATLSLLAARQIALVGALLRRGHASMDRIRPAGSGEDVDASQWRKKVHALTAGARERHDWSRFANPDGALIARGRDAAEAKIAAWLADRFVA